MSSGMAYFKGFICFQTEILDLTLPRAAATSRAFPAAAALNLALATLVAAALRRPGGSHRPRLPPLPIFLSLSAAAGGVAGKDRAAWRRRGACWSGLGEGRRRPFLPASAVVRSDGGRRCQREATGSGGGWTLAPSGLEPCRDPGLAVRSTLVPTTSAIP